MNETELERLIIRLVGDGSSYASMLKEAQTGSTATAQHIAEATKQIEGMSGSIQGFVGSAVSGLAALGASKFLSDAGEIWDKREKSIIQMSSTLRSNGREVDALSQQYLEFAQSISSQTNASTGDTMALLRQAETFGLTGRQAQEATRRAIAFGAVNDGNAEQYLRFTVAMSQGNTEMMKHMARMIPQLRGITDEQELMAKANQLVNTGWSTAIELGSTNNAELERAGRAWKGLLGDIGQVIDEAAAPLATIFKDLVSWLREMPKEGKLLIAVVVGLVAAMAALPPLILLAGTIFNTMFGGVGLLIGAIVAGGVAIAYWVNQLGGVSEAWKALVETAKPYISVLKQVGLIIWQYLVSTWKTVQAAALVAWDFIKTKVGAFWNWAQPIIAAAISFMITAWDGLKKAAVIAWDAIKEVAYTWWEGMKALFGFVLDLVTSVWTSIFGETTSTWDDIADAIALSITMAEFAIKNFDKIANFAWVSIKLGWVVMVEEIKHFPAVIGAILSWVGENWAEIFITMHDFAGTVFKNIAENAKNIFRGLGDALVRFMRDPRQGITLNTEGMWTPLTEGFRSSIRSLPEIPRREMGETERALRAEWEAMRDDLQQTWEEFRLSRLGPLGTEESVREAEKAGEEIGGGFSKGAEKGLEKFEAVAARSAEALTRIAAYRDKIDAGNSRAQQQAANAARALASPASSGALPSAAEARTSSGSSSSDSQATVVTRLTEIRDALRILIDRPPIQVVGADL